MDDQEQTKAGQAEEAETEQPEVTSSDEGTPEEQVKGDEQPSAMDALKSLGAGLGSAIRAAASTPEAEQLKESARSTASSVSEELGGKVEEAEETETGKKLKAGTASLLGSAGSALGKLADKVETDLEEAGRDEDADESEQDA